MSELFDYPRGKPLKHVPLVQPDRLNVDAERFPDVTDLADRLRFSPEDGRIWLDGQRMLLIHSSAFGALRRELIDSLGVDCARGLLTRMGFHAGTLDAQIARRVRPSATLQEMFFVGPQLHSLEGIVQVDLVRMEIDVAQGSYYGEFIWKGSSEDEAHLQYHGVGTEPSCWMQIGYASGYTSEFMGRPVLFREVECQSMGQPECRIVGRPAEEWGDGAEDLRFLRAQPFAQGIVAGKSGNVGSSTEPFNSRHVEPGTFGDIGMVGVSPGFNSVCHMIKRVAPTQATVLFLGESGVGKEVFARALHRVSARRDQPFVALNCAALPESLVEAELFGVEKGAYTGAAQSRLGRFERANGGTLFLDEIGILSGSAQGKLLRALQEGEVERLGDHATRNVDVRVIAATNANLRDEVAAGRFREDLFFRLNVFPIRIPPLRERREDIPVLMHHFLQRFSQRHHRDLAGFTDRAIDAMLAYDWPGNIRELENVIERGIILGTDGHPIDVGHLFTSGEKFNPHHYGLDRKGGLTASDRLRQAASQPAEEDYEGVTKRLCDLLLDAGSAEGLEHVSLDDIETALLKKAVKRTHGNLSAAARVLGLTRAQLVYRLKSRSVVVDES